MEQLLDELLFTSDLEKQHASFNACMRTALDTIHARHPEFNISTLTVLVRLHVTTKYNILRVAERCKTDDAVMAALEEMQQEHSLDALEVKTDSSFYNSITFCFANTETGRKRSIKLFVNNLLHITGPPSVDDAIALAESFCTVLAAASDARQAPRVDGFSVQLINTNFNLGFCLDVEVLSDLVRSNSSHHVHYDRERHMGCNIKVGGVTVIAFHTGNVLITGAHHPDAMLAAYEFVVGFTEQHRDAVMCEERVRKRRKTPFDYGRYIDLA
jgi:TATA-box binding protein (TBP) (component of TFIID and TFIIIB)